MDAGLGKIEHGPAALPQFPNGGASARRREDGALRLPFPQKGDPGLLRAAVTVHRDEVLAEEDDAVPGIAHREIPQGPQPGHPVLASGVVLVLGSGINQGRCPGEAELIHMDAVSAQAIDPLAHEAAHVIVPVAFPSEEEVLRGFRAAGLHRGKEPAAADGGAHGAAGIEPEGFLLLMAAEAGDDAGEEGRGVPDLPFQAEEELLAASAPWLAEMAGEVVHLISEPGPATEGNDEYDEGEERPGADDPIDCGSCGEKSLPPRNLAQEGDDVGLDGPIDPVLGEVEGFRDVRLFRRGCWLGCRSGSGGGRFFDWFGLRR